MTTAPGLRREIVRLAVPSLGALLAEPVFLLVDTGIVGHLGTPQLAGVGIAGVILSTAVGLSIFLAYSTTASVARSLGAGDRGGALAHGVDGLYLGVAIGVILALLGAAAAGVLVHALGAGPDAAGYGITYLRWSLPGLPGMLLVLASTGVLRGLQDARTPLVVATAGAVLNIGLNLLLVVGLHWGVAGSAIGTALSQTAMALALLVVVGRAAHRQHVSLRPRLHGIRGAGRAGFPLLVRTATLRIAIIATTMIAAHLGVQALAANQVVTSIWNFLALGLDALAIAAQALTGKALGEGDPQRARALTAAMLRWGVAAGAVIGVAVLALHLVAGSAFSPDPTVRHAVGVALIVVAVTQPLAGWVFVLDGVLIGAGDGKFLALAGVVNLAVYLPAGAAVWAFAPNGTAGLVWLWVAYAGAYMAARAATLGWRYRGTGWQVTGAALDT